MAVTQVSDYLPYVRHLQQEHRKISQLVDQVEAAYFLSDRWPIERTELTDSLLRDLRSLRKQLQRHFEEEETGGAVEEAVSRLPRLAAEWHNLETEHGDLLDQLDGVIDMAENRGFCGRGAEAIERCFHAFAEMLYDHETAENRLIQQGFNVGSEDVY